MPREMASSSLPPVSTVSVRLPMTIAVPVSWHIGSTPPAETHALRSRSVATKRSFGDASGSSTIARSWARCDGRSRCWMSCTASRTSAVIVAGSISRNVRPRGVDDRARREVETAVLGVVGAQGQHVGVVELGHAPKVTRGGGREAGPAPDQSDPPGNAREADGGGGGGGGRQRAGGRSGEPWGAEEGRVGTCRKRPESQRERSGAAEDGAVGEDAARGSVRVVGSEGEGWGGEGRRMGGRASTPETSAGGGNGNLWAGEGRVEDRGEGGRAEMRIGLNSGLLRGGGEEREERAIRRRPRESGDGDRARADARSPTARDA